MNVGEPENDAEEPANDDDGGGGGSSDGGGDDDDDAIKNLDSRKWARRTAGENRRKAPHHTKMNLCWK